ncbi:MAG: EAL domain-containing protein [Gammaproteobacteria bacterium]|nr:EAL domain-containing protein [Gammaproteobacteria bacterium]
MNLLRRLRPISIRAHLALGFGLLIALTLACGLLAISSQEQALSLVERYFGHEQRIAELSLKSNASLYKARRYEKEFLLRRKALGFREARARYASLFQMQLTELRGHMAEIRHLKPSAEWLAEVDTVEQSLAQYESQFIQVVEDYGRLGFTNSGLEGRFRDAAHELERLLAEGAPAELRAGLLQLRRHEKDFLLRDQPKYFRQFDQAAEAFRLALTQAPLPAERRQRLLAQADAYRSGFGEYFKLEQAMDRRTDSYLDAVHRIEPALDRLYQKTHTAAAGTQQDLQAQSGELRRILLGVAVGAGLLGLLIALRIGRGVNRSVQRCTDFAERLTGGDLDARLFLDKRHEFSGLADALSLMAASVQAAFELDRGRIADLARLNRTLRVLSRCNEALVRARSEAELLQTTVHILCELGGFAQAWVLLAEDGEWQGGPAALAGQDRDLGPWPLAHPQSPWSQALAERRELALCARREAPGATANTWMVLPLVGRGAPLGVLVLRSDSPQAGDADELRLLRELADDLGFGMASLRDSEARADIERRLDYQTNFDTLTGLPNRNLLHDRLHQAMLATNRSGRISALLRLNLDRFKYINDSLGPGAGDRMLREVGLRLTSRLREDDTVAHLSADEFAIVLHELGKEDDVASLARELQASLSRPYALADCELAITASMGICLYPRDGPDIDSLLKNSDIALQHARALGGDTIRYYAPEMNERLSARLAMEAGLRRALERGELRVYYQPKVNLQSGRICGAEALMRWQHPEIGMVPPSDFIPLAEETGLILPLGEWILEQVCAQQRAWLDAGLDSPRLAVNLSARQFHQQDLRGCVERLLQRHRLKPAMLELEITESAVMQDVLAAIKVLEGLKDVGVKLSLDDFGTGYSSLSYLKRFPLDTLKIDQSFVRDIVSNPHDAAICLSIVGLAHHLQMHVVAEGVETLEQMSYLRRHGCDEMQGYYFSRPLTGEAYAQLLAADSRLSLPAETDESRGTLLIVDDEPHVQSAVKRALRNSGYRILTASGAAEGLKLLAQHEIQVILTDQRMPEMSGSEFLSRVKELYPDTIRLVLSGHTELATLTEAINRGAIYKFLTKPWSDEHLQEQVQDAFRQHAARRTG